MSDKSDEIEELFDFMLGDNDNKNDGVPVSAVSQVSDSNTENSVEALFDALMTENGASVSGINGEAAPQHTSALSSFQQRLWFLQQLSPDNVAYIIPMHMRIRGPLNEGALKEAVQFLWRRHDALRTFFPIRDGQPVRTFLPADSFTIHNYDFSSDPDPKAWEKHYLEHHSGPMKMDEGPMLRVCLYTTEKDNHALLIDLHHINGDGFTTHILREELFKAYEAYAEDRVPDLPEIKASYDMFVARETARTESAKKELEKRTEKLSGAPTLIDFRFDHALPENFTDLGGVIERSYNDLSQYNRAFARGRETRLTPFMVLLAAYGATLYSLSGQEDILIGVPMSVRPDESYAHTVGFFVNTCIARLDLSGNPTLRELMRRAGESVREMLSTPEVQIDRLINTLRVERRKDRPPLVQTALSFLMNERPAPVPPKGLCVESFHLLRRSSMFELSMDILLHQGGGFSCMEYYEGAWEPRTIERAFDRFHRILKTIADNPDATLSDVSCALDSTDLPKLKPILEGRELEESFLTVPDLLRGHAIADPKRTALICESVGTSRHALERLVSIRRGQLRKLGLKPGNILALACAPGVEWVATALAAMSECGIVLPQDPEGPAERLASILKDSGATLLWHDEAFDTDRMPSGSVCRTVDNITAPESAPVDDPVFAHPGMTAYIIYTSGTTGKPKGVRVSHGAFAAHCRAAAMAYGLTPADRALAFAPVYFDAFWEQLFAPLAAGASVLVRDTQIWAPEQLCKRLAVNRVTIADLPPQYLAELLFFLRDKPKALPASLRLVLSGGEAMPASIAREWRQSGVLSHIPLVNAYGPTEAVVTATINRIDKSTRIDTADGVVPIGRPMPGRFLRVLDENGREVDAGVPGELCIGGMCLAEGYHNDPERTAAVFRFWTHTQNGGQWTEKDTPEAVRLYRTGDRVRIGPEDSIEFLGRIDKQLKIRGHRIEPGEIESVLTRHPAIAQALVTALDHPVFGRQIVAYCISRDGKALSRDEMKEWMEKRLPESMIPASTSFLKKFPTTPSGKIDTAALPQPEFGQTEPSSQRKGPTDETERRVSAIWTEILGRADIGTDDNFFDMGGHSILLVRLNTRLNAEFDAKIRLVDLFASPTVKRMAALLRGDRKAAVTRNRRARQGDVAVIGMSGRFPQAATVNEFWDNLASGQECIRFFSQDELAAAGIPETLRRNPSYVPAHGFMEGTKCFDAGFFGYTPREAALIDPQQRIFLQECWHVLEDAGCDPDRFRGEIGVFGGMGMSLYLLENLFHMLHGERGAEAYAASLSNDKDFITTRVSYKLNLRGPSVNVNTACSTSLVAIHLAAEALLRGECDMALAGGVTLHIPPTSGYLYQPGAIASPDGHCRAFSQNASGTVGGSGCAVVALKTLDCALADGDSIHAVIKGSAINNDGSDKVGFTAPSVGRQRDVIRAALDLSGLNARDIAYVEAHGTGTPMGDPIEIQALSEAFAPDDPPAQGCIIGAVKSNIGHLDTAAGAAGFIKTVLALEHDIIPPTLHCGIPDPKIDFPHTPFRVAQKIEKWPDDRKRRAAVSAFGMGGTNAHVILEEAPALPSVTPRQVVWCLPVSARSAQSLLAFAGKLASFIEARPESDAENLWFTLSEGRRRFDTRAVILAASSTEAVSKLRALKKEDLLQADGRDNSATSGYGCPQKEAFANDTVFESACAFADEWLTGDQKAASDLLPKHPHRKIPLPGYVFDETECWVEPQETVSAEKTESAALPDIPHKLPLEEWLHYRTWERLPLPEGSPQTSEPVLVLHRGSPAETRWMADARRNGLAFTACLSGDGMEGTLSWMAANGPIPSVCWHIGGLGNNSTDSGKDNVRTLANLMEDLRKLAAVKNGTGMRITFLAPADEIPVTEPAPDLAYLGATAAVIGHEYSDFEANVLYIGPDSCSPRELENMRRISETAGDNAVAAFSRGKYWRMSHRNLPVPKLSKGETRLVRNGVYLITGGLGGIGLSIAAYLAEHWNARLLLVSRNAPGASKMVEIDAMRQHGATVKTAALDVADASALKLLVDKTCREWGRIDGVIHAAGVPGGSLIARTNAEEIERVLRPKIAGTLALREALEERTPSFVMLCSSLTATLGGPGQTAYAVANAWMDAFAEEQSASSPGIWTSVQWDAWAQVGMAARAFQASGTAKIKGTPLREWTLSPKEYWPWGEHRIKGTPTLPGTGYLDIFARISETGMPFEMDSVTISDPLTGKDDDSIRLQALKSGEVIALVSGEGAQALEHSRARFSMNRPAVTPRLPVEEIQARCHPVDEGNAPSHGSGIIIEAGPRWRVTSSIMKGEREALGTFGLADEFHADTGEHPLHPALLDVALSYYMAFVEGADKLLPWRYERITVYAPLKPIVLSYARLKNSNPRMMVLDVDIADTEGNVLMRVEGYTLIRANTEASQPGTTAHAASGNPFAMTPSEGVETFLRVLASKEPVIEVSTVDWKYARHIPLSGSLRSNTSATGSTQDGSTRQPRPDLPTPYRAPSTENEQCLTQIWAEVLGYEKIGVDDDLFDLGADSLTALQASGRLREKTGCDLPMERFFENATVAFIAQGLPNSKPAENADTVWEEGEI